MSLIIGNYYVGLKKIENTVPIKGFIKIDDILDSSFSSKFGVFSTINNQLEICGHTVEEVKIAINDILSFGEDFVGYKNNGLCRNILNFLKDGGNINELDEFFKYKFNTINIIEDFLIRNLLGQ